MSPTCCWRGRPRARRELAGGCRRQPLAGIRRCSRSRCSAGGPAGAWLARLGVVALMTLAPADLPRAEEVQVDALALLFALRWRSARASSLVWCRRSRCPAPDWGRVARGGQGHVDRFARRLGQKRVRGRGDRAGDGARRRRQPARPQPRLAVVGGHGLQAGAAAGAEHRVSAALLRRKRRAPPRSIATCSPTCGRCRASTRWEGSPACRARCARTAAIAIDGAPPLTPDRSPLAPGDFQRREPGLLRDAARAGPPRPRLCRGDTARCAVRRHRERVPGTRRVWRRRSARPPHSVRPGPHGFHDRLSGSSATCAPMARPVPSSRSSSCRTSSIPGRRAG